LLALPVVETPGTPLAFRRWTPGMGMERGHWGIPVPPATSERLTPEISLAPLVGWDAEGYRLGYGGGYFDRTLAALAPKPFVIGVGLQSARLATIAPQPHDVPLSVIVTEAGVQIERDRGAG
jgi:5-formyltetrahydrofolate cyclo-ligase